MAESCQNKLNKNRLFQLNDETPFKSFPTQKYKESKKTQCRVYI